MLVLKVLGWTILAVLGIFALLLSFHFFGVGATWLVLAPLLVVLELTYGRRWRKRRGLSENPRKRWRQAMGDEPRDPIA